MPEKTKVATIHTHFHIYRDIHEAHIGPVTRAEEVKALTRFVRWHARQLQVGQILLRQLLDAPLTTEGQEDQHGVSRTVAVSGTGEASSHVSTPGPLSSAPALRAAESETPPC